MYLYTIEYKRLSRSQKEEYKTAAESARIALRNLERYRCKPYIYRIINVERVGEEE